MWWWNPLIYVVSSQICIFCTTSECNEPTGWPRRYRKYILQITQPSQYRYTKSPYRFAVTAGWPIIPRSFLVETLGQNNAEEFIHMLWSNRICVYLVAPALAHFVRIKGVFRGGGGRGPAGGRKKIYIHNISFCYILGVYSQYHIDDLWTIVS